MIQADDPHFTRPVTDGEGADAVGLSIASGPFNCALRPTSTPQRKVTTRTALAVPNRKTNCFPLSWIS